MDDKAFWLHLLNGGNDISFVAVQFFTSKSTRMGIATQQGRSGKAVKSILLATLIAGILDASGAMINFKINVPSANPLVIWRGVAGGAFGDTARSGDLYPWAIVGIGFHFLIVFLFTLFFFFIYPRLKALQKNLIITGLLYGIFVWAVMNMVVLPFSNIKSQNKMWALVNTDGRLHAIFQGTSNVKQMVIGIVIIMFCVGLPIALIIGKYYSKKLK